MIKCRALTTPKRELICCNTLVSLFPKKRTILRANRTRAHETADDFRASRLAMTLSLLANAALSHESNAVGPTTLWSTEDDLLLVSLIHRYGLKWKVIARDMNRTVASVRNRYLRQQKSLCRAVRVHGPEIDENAPFFDGAAASCSTPPTMSGGETLPQHRRDTAVPDGPDLVQTLLENVAAGATNSSKVDRSAGLEPDAQPKRGPQRCAACGQPRRGHTCMAKLKSRTRLALGSIPLTLFEEHRLDERNDESDDGCRTDALFCDESLPSHKRKRHLTAKEQTPFRLLRQLVEDASTYTDGDEKDVLDSICPRSASFEPNASNKSHASTLSTESVETAIFPSPGLVACPFVVVPQAFLFSPFQTAAQ